MSGVSNSHALTALATDDFSCVNMPACNEGTYDCWPNELADEIALAEMPAERRFIELAIYCRWYRLRAADTPVSDAPTWDYPASPADLRGWLEYMNNVFDADRDDAPVVISHAERTACLACAEAFFDRMADLFAAEGRKDLAEAAMRMSDTIPL